MDAAEVGTEMRQKSTAAAPARTITEAVMSYRRAERWELWHDAWVVRIAMLIAATDERQRFLDDMLVRSAIVQGEDGTLRVLC